jgi:hypothetical protein
MHLKVFVKLNKNPKNPLVWAKKPKKPKKTQKNPKKPTGLGFFKKTRVFSNPGRIRIRIQLSEAWIRGSGSGSTPKCHGSATLGKGKLSSPRPNPLSGDGWS